MLKQMQSIKISIKGKENIAELQGRMIQWTTEKYQQFLEDLNKEQLSPIIFALLEEDVFLETFGKTKKELEHLKTKRF